ncbi:pyridoxamine 5'-phosphate oxidase family protein [Clostridium sp. YIM B02569]|uniref:pyridoxamine 5'-phosphate oxidase family protein n=1 Tax=Clostridium sp. YIM B02569 TaxID=2911967 RepID=UPI001EEA0F5F|nr:pyridoxamine 5'-phosphate oxidase family protein [Clostridium sp. YIM B02569]
MDGDQPRVRPFGAVMKYNDKLYFATNNTKSVFEQLVANPKVEISTTSPKGEWIRLTGKAVFDSSTEVKSAMLESVPSLRVCQDFRVNFKK